MLCYYFLILLYDRFNQLQFCGFQSMILYKRYRENRKLRFCVTLHDMHMDWLMIVSIEKESESKKDENSRHL